jgi:hypothetical protein
LLVCIPHQTTLFLKFRSAFTNLSVWASWHYFPTAFQSPSVISINYSLSFSFKAKIKFCFNICTVQITNTMYTSVCFPAHKKLNLIVYTITNVPILDTWYCFLCLYYNQIMVWVITGSCHLWCSCVCGSYRSVIMCTADCCRDIVNTLVFFHIHFALLLPRTLELTASWEGWERKWSWRKFTCSIIYLVWLKTMTVNSGCPVLAIFELEGSLICTGVSPSHPNVWYTLWNGEGLKFSKFLTCSDVNSQLLS